MNKYIAAIDLGTTKIITIAGEKTSSGVKIIGYSEAPSTGIMRGEVVNIQKVINTVLPTIEDVEEQIDNKITSVFVGIAGQNIRSESVNKKKDRSSNQFVTQEEIDQMIQEVYETNISKGEKIFHVIPQSYNIEEHMGITDPVGMMGANIEGNYKIFLGKENSTIHPATVIQRVGQKLGKFILEPIASAKAVLTPDEMELGVALVDIGGGTSDLIIYQNNIIRHTAVIPFGGNSITEDIRQVCGVSLKHAEMLKKKHGSCISEYAPENKTIVIPGLGGRGSKEVSYKLLSSTIEARLEEIIQTIIYEIEKAGYKNRLPGGIVVTGGSSRIVHLNRLVHLMSGYSIRLGYPDENTIMANSIEDVFNPAASTAVGLIIEGAEYINTEDKAFEEEYKEDDQSTLFPNEELKNETIDSPKIKKPKEKKKPKENFKDMIGGIFKGIWDETDNEA